MYVRRVFVVQDAGFVSHVAERLVDDMFVSAEVLADCMCVLLSLCSGLASILNCLKLGKMISNTSEHVF